MKVRPRVEPVKRLRDTERVMYSPNNTHQLLLGGPLNRTDVVRLVAMRTGVPIATVDQIVGELIKVIKSNLTLDEEVVLRGFGKFAIRVKPPRRQFIPASREFVELPEAKAIVFLPSRAFKERLNQRRS